MEAQRLFGEPDPLVEAHPFLHPIAVPRLPAPIWLRLARMPCIGHGRHASVDRLDRLVRLDEELQFHLLELAGSENEIAGGHLIPERLADLSDSERNLLAGRLVDILELGEDRLGRLRPQVGDVLVGLDGPDVGLEHQIERPRIGQLGPVLGVEPGGILRLLGAFPRQHRLADAARRVELRSHIPSAFRGLSGG